MREQSVEKTIKTIERKMWLRKALPQLLVDIAISAFISDPHIAGEAHKEAHKLDTLPHD